MSSFRVSPLAVIFITVFIDMLSFGIVIPDIQIRANKYGADGFLLGVLLASFSFAQFCAAPFAGRLSDRVGRKSVLATGALLNAIGFIFYAYADSLTFLFIGRIIGGIGSSNLSAAYAYVSDVSKPELRAKSMGILGAAFGMGFIFGPPVGGMLSVSGGNYLLGMASASIAFMNVFWIVAFLKEPEKHAEAKQFVSGFKFEYLRKALRSPGLLALLLMFFMYNLGFSNLESTFILLSYEQYGLSEKGSGFYLGYIGIMIAFVQGILVGPLTARFGERKLVRYGLLLVVPSFISIPFFPNVWMMALFAPFFCLGLAVSTPATQSLISKTTSRDMQGGIFGLTQGLGALARICGPLIGQTTYKLWYALPYIVGGGLIFIALLVAWAWIPEPKREGVPPTAVPAE